MDWNERGYNDSVRNNFISKTALLTAVGLGIVFSSLVCIEGELTQEQFLAEELYFTEAISLIEWLKLWLPASDRMAEVMVASDRMGSYGCLFESLMLIFIVSIDIKKLRETSTQVFKGEGQSGKGHS